MPSFSSARRMRVAPILLISVILATTLYFAYAGAPSAYSKAKTGRSLFVDVPQGVPVRLSLLQIPQVVRSQIPDAQIESITARSLLSQAHGVEAGAGQPPAGRDGGPVWIVRARGTFVGHFVAPGHEPVRFSTGYLLIADRTGDVFGMGMP